MNTCSHPEQLIQFADGELDAAQSAAVREHLGECAECARAWRSIAAADQAIGKWFAGPAPGVIRTVERSLTEELHRRVPAMEAEIMTVEEVADYLKIAPEEVAELLPELPLFELAGKLRIRRGRLLQWIEECEAVYRREKVASWTRQVALGAA